jgi:transcription elongation GreA/GreB family factor
MVEGIAVIALSPQSPLGAKLIGLTVGGFAEINNTQYTVENIE